MAIVAATALSNWKLSSQLSGNKTCLHLLAR